MDAINNKPCPFCGGTPKLLNRIELKGNSFVTLFRVQCSVCHAATAEFDTNYLTLMAWNSRSCGK